MYNNEDDSDDEDEVFCDPDTDPNVLRKVYVLEGEMDEDEEDDEDDSQGPGAHGGAEEEASSNFALRPDGYADERDEEQEVCQVFVASSC